MIDGQGVARQLSVIVPVFNGAWCIERCLEALLAEQAKVPVEVIVVDDGSIDRTAEILERYAGRVRVLGQANAGPGAARNLGINASTGAFVAFMDSDDEIAPGTAADAGSST